MNIRRIIWGVVLLGTFFFFNNYISVYTWHEARFILSLLGGILLGVFLMQTVCAYSGMYELMPDEDDRDWRYNFRLFWPIAMIAGTAYFFLVSSYREDNLVAAKGVKVVGKIEGGQYRSNSKGVVSNTVIRFKTAEQKEMKLEIAFNLDEFRSLYVDQPVEVIYLPDNPKIYRLIYNAATYEAVTGISSRPLVMADLEKMLDTIHTQEALGACLNKICYRWEMEMSEAGEPTWKNVSTEQSIILKPGIYLMVAGLEASNDRSTQIVIPDAYKRKKELEGSGNMKAEKKKEVMTIEGTMPAVLYDKGAYKLITQTAWQSGRSLQYLILAHEWPGPEKISEKN
ncbi:hypothetical protein [Chitinophaga qingshengii]|uniref:DUF4131 domain-containing protein n=1 Tax=Chitinophaga qingshengii TaxID=1569794 RepID=A0ABR7TNH5_9BACT|nr:hypothetical protein [Chitinophaga qingshengii]MBC9931061.1 hypothetical protein [Chitinophaga qingshengii]